MTERSFLRSVPRPIRPALVATAILLVGLSVDAALAAEPPAAARPPDLLLVTLDTTRADRVGAYSGADPSPTPNLDRLARRGVLFRRAFATVPLTTPSHATILTGLTPKDHTVRDNRAFVLPDEVPTLPQILHRAGYRTAAFVSSVTVARETGLARGFELYDDLFSRSSEAREEAAVKWRGFAEVERSARGTIDRWLAVDRRTRDPRPAFTWIHLFDAHFPYAPPEPWASRWATDPYLGELAFADDQLGRLLRRLEEAGRLERTVIVVAADHGEGLGEHGEPAHGNFLWDSTIRVPLVIVPAGGLASPRVVDPTVSLADIAPTLLARAGAGEGLDPAASRVDLLGSAFPEERTVLAETIHPFYTFGYAPLVSSRSADATFIRGAREELIAEPRRLPFDSPVGAAPPSNLPEELSRRLRSAVRDYVRDDGRRVSRARTISEEDEKELAALGYLAGGGSGSTGGLWDRPGLDDPRDRMATLNLFAEISADRFAGRDDLAARRLEVLLQKEPTNDRAARNLLEIRVERQDQVGVVRALELASKVTAGGGSPELRLVHGRALVLLGRLDEAAALFGECARLFPAVRGCELTRLETLLAQGKGEEVVAGVRSAIAADPSLRRDLPIRSFEARGLEVAGRNEEALAAWRAIRGDFPAEPDPVRRQARLLLRLERWEELSGELAGPLPEDTELLWIIAVAKARTGQGWEARQAFEAMIRLEAARSGGRLDPDVETAKRKELFPMLVETGQVQDAATLLLDAPRGRSSPGETLYLVADLAARVGDLEAAGRLFAQSFGADPTVPAPLLTLVRLERARGNCREAGLLLMTFSDLHPETFRAFASGDQEVMELIDNVMDIARVREGERGRPAGGGKKP